MVAASLTQSSQVTSSWPSTITAKRMARTLASEPPQQRLAGFAAPGARQSVCAFGSLPLRTV